MTSPPNSPSLTPFAPPYAPVPLPSLPPPPPTPPGAVARLRPEPPSAAAPGRLLAAAGLAGLLAATVLADVRPGVGVPLVALAVAVAVALGGATVGGPVAGNAGTGARRLLLAVCLILTAVAAVRAAGPDFSGWNCTPKTFALSSTAVNGCV